MKLWYSPYLKELNEDGLFETDISVSAELADYFDVLDSADEEGTAVTDFIGATCIVGGAAIVNSKHGLRSYYMDDDNGIANEFPMFMRRPSQDLWDVEVEMGVGTLMLTRMLEREYDVDVNTAMHYGHAILGMRSATQARGDQFNWVLSDSGGKLTQVGLQIPANLDFTQPIE